MLEFSGELLVIGNAKRRRKKQKPMEKLLSVDEN